MTKNRKLKAQRLRRIAARVERIMTKAREESVYGVPSLAEAFRRVLTEEWSK
jgi:hypothetical protein